MFGKGAVEGAVATVAANAMDIAVIVAEVAGSVGARMIGRIGVCGDGGLSNDKGGISLG